MNDFTKMLSQPFMICLYLGVVLLVEAIVCHSLMLMFWSGFNVGIGVYGIGSYND